MTIRAEEDTGFGFASKLIDPARDATVSEREVLRGRSEMVKLKCSVAPIVSADATGSTRFRHEFPLHDPAASRHGLRAAPRAGEHTVGPPDVLCLAMAGADSRRFSKTEPACLVEPPPPGHSLSAEAQSVQVAPHRRFTDPELFGNHPDACPGAQQSLKSLPVHETSVTAGPNGKTRTCVRCATHAELVWVSAYSVTKTPRAAPRPIVAAGCCARGSAQLGGRRRRPSRPRRSPIPGDAARAGGS